MLTGSNYNRFGRVRPFVVDFDELNIIVGNSVTEAPPFNNSVLIASYICACLS
jgi:hypothetical protein